MKKLALFFVSFLILYGIYYDLTTGTLPSASASTNSVQESDEFHADKQVQGVVVERGHTVLSIVEQLHVGPVPASIQEIIYDFKRLNNDMNPEEIQPGKTYQFPLYQK